MEFLKQSILSLVTGVGAGVLFSFLKLPVPAPPVIPAVFGILGITLGYMIVEKLF